MPHLEQSKTGTKVARRLLLLEELLLEADDLSTGSCLSLLPTDRLNLPSQCDLASLQNKSPMTSNTNCDNCVVVSYLALLPLAWTASRLLLPLSSSPHLRTASLESALFPGKLLPFSPPKSAPSLLFLFARGTAALGAFLWWSGSKYWQPHPAKRKTWLKHPETEIIL